MSMWIGSMHGASSIISVSFCSHNVLKIILMSAFIFRCFKKTQHGIGISTSHAQGVLFSPLTAPVVFLLNAKIVLGRVKKLQFLSLRTQLQC